MDVVFAYIYMGILYYDTLPPIHMCISAELSAIRLNTLLGVITANAFGLQRYMTQTAFKLN